MYVRMQVLVQVVGCRKNKQINKKYVKKKSVEADPKDSVMLLGGDDKLSREK